MRKYLKRKLPAILCSFFTLDGIGAFVWAFYNQREPIDLWGVVLLLPMGLLAVAMLGYLNYHLWCTDEGDWK